MADDLQVLADALITHRVDRQFMDSPVCLSERAVQRFDPPLPPPPPSPPCRFPPFPPATQNHLKRLPAARRSGASSASRTSTPTRSMPP